MHYYRLRAGTKLASDERSEGEKHGNAKLTADNVREHRWLYETARPCDRFSEKFGVSNLLTLQRGVGQDVAAPGSGPRCTAQAGWSIG